MISKNQMRLVRLLGQKKHRTDEGLFVAEGPKVVGDLLSEGFVARMLFATDQWVSDARHTHAVQAVSDDELQRLSFVQHPQQVLGVFEMAHGGEDLTEAWPADGGLHLALDGVRDPGNLGTIIRIADWFGIDSVMCSEDTADAWSPKVVQATMGSIARVRIVYCDLPQVLGRAGCRLYGTLLDGRDIYAQPLSKSGIIVMGNESNGISQPVRQLLTDRLLIPNFHRGASADSLNVATATAIVCSEFRRRGTGVRACAAL